MTDRTRNRLICFTGAVTLHMGLFFVLMSVPIEKKQYPKADSASFGIVKIPVSHAPVQPPPLEPPLTLTVPSPSIPIGSTAAANFIPIIPSFASSFKLPPPPISIRSDVFTQDFMNSGDGKGETTEGNSSGTEVGQEDGDNRQGGEIDPGAIVRVVMDTSPKMLQYNASAGPYAKLHFNPTLFGKNLVIWGTFSGSGRYTPIEHPDMPPQHRGDDLYGAIYNAINTKPTPDVLVIFADFDEGYIPEATSDLIVALREKKIKLILITSKMAAYPGLAKYAHESGGNYRKLSFKGANDFNGSQELNPILPSCGALNFGQSAQAECYQCSQSPLCSSWLVESPHGGLVCMLPSSHFLWPVDTLPS